MNNNFILLTVATDRNKWLDDWESSAIKWKYNYKILGIGEKWEGFKTLLNLIIKFCKNTDSDKLLCIVDSYDVIIAGPKNELIEKFNSINKKIILGTENVCGPNCFKTEINVSNKSRPFINTGFVMGKCKDLLKMYEESILLCNYDDQVGISKYAKINPNYFHLDSNQSLVLNLNYSKEIEDLKLLNNGRFHYIPTNVNPIIIHTPFMQKDLGKRCNFIRNHALNNYKKISKLNFLIEFIKHLKKHMKNPVYKKLTSIIISIIILIIFIIFYLLYKIYK